MDITENGAANAQQAEHPHEKEKNVVAHGAPTQLKKSDFYYDLPEELIAQTPAEPRDSSRLLVYNRADGSIEHRIFREITDYLRAGDVLVVNNTKVIPARIFAKRVLADGSLGDGECEVLLLKRLDYTVWECITRPAKKLRVGTKLMFSDRLQGEVVAYKEEGIRDIKFTFDGVFEDILDEIGNMPLPPYITKKLEDKNRYQTVYCKTNGSAAAPTAGLHFTPELLEKIKRMGVQVATVLLHVGLGTFRPVKEENVLDHKMHSEYYRVDEENAAIITAAKREGRRVICVGTTSVRVLESVAKEDGTVEACSGDTDIFIYPGYKFKVVDALITNFHLPQSTLLMLVSAFIGRENALEMYRIAVEEGYRFFSFGDATLIL